MLHFSFFYLQDCSTFQSAAFSCQRGLQGGQKTDRNIDNNCKYQGPYSPEWHNLLCYITENNPYLGLFFQNEPSIQNYQKYLDKVKSPKYTYEDTDVHIQQEDVQPYYVFGTGIEVTMNTEDTISGGFLSLPQPVLYGMCVDKIPIRFLEDFSHDCSIILSPEICKTEQYLNSATYLRESDFLDSEPYSGVPQVVSNLTSHQVINASVSYECAQDVTNFIKAEGLNEFPQHLWKSKSTSFGECDHQKVPYYNETSHLCENVVLHVEYNINWKGSTVQEVNANILIGNVPVTLENVDQKYLSKLKGNIYKTKERTHKKSSLRLHLVQQFKVMFHHVGTYNMSNDTLDVVSYNPGNDTEEELGDIISLPNITERSGNPGYQRGKPLLAGYAM